MKVRNGRVTAELTDILPVAVAWTIAAFMIIVGAVLIVGVFTAPFGIALIVWASAVAGRSYLKLWNRMYDMELGNPTSN